MLSVSIVSDIHESLINPDNLRQSTKERNVSGLRKGRTEVAITNVTISRSEMMHMDEELHTKNVSLLYGVYPVIVSVQ